MAAKTAASGPAIGFAEFKGSLAEHDPPAGLAPAAQALWWSANGDHARAHELAQRSKDRAGAWVHAHLHRVEGDDENARYWYGRAGRPPSTLPRDAEWEEIAKALLGRGQG